MPNQDHIPLSDARLLTRRAVLRAGLVTLGGSTLMRVLAAEAAGQSTAADKRSVIVLWAAGGPSHIDMWDMKPDAPIEYRGEFNSIKTSIPGYHLCEYMPRLARICDKLAILRSVYHSVTEHSQATHTMLTGYAPTKGDPANEVPSCGSIVAKELGPRDNGFPPYVATQESIRSSNAAYLGVEYNPFQTFGYPTSSAFKVRNLTLPPSVDAPRLSRRQSMLERLDSLRENLDHSGDLASIDIFRRRALELVTSTQVAEAFNLNQEDESTREIYGRKDSAGQSALLARRLVEAGARFVTVRMSFQRPWDSHTNNFADHRVMIPGYDRVVSALINDLDQRGLLETTLVLVMGEFGRTPKINAKAGRDHWPGAFTVVMAGGGLQPGCILGQTDARAEAPRERPIKHQDVLATLYHQLGIDHHITYRNTADRPVPILNDGEPIQEILKSSGV